MVHSPSSSARGFVPEKHPVRTRAGMVVTNHPLASAAGAEMLAAGGNAIDAAVAALFTLTVVEPMMVGILGGGFAHFRLPDGTHHILEGQGQCPAAVGPDTFEYDRTASPGALESVGRRHSLGRGAVAVPGTLKAWCEMLGQHGSLPLEASWSPRAATHRAALPSLATCRNALPRMRATSCWTPKSPRSSCRAAPAGAR